MSDTRNSAQDIIQPTPAATGSPSAPERPLTRSEVAAPRSPVHTPRSPCDARPAIMDVEQARATVPTVRSTRSGVRSWKYTITPQTSGSSASAYAPAPHTSTTVRAVATFQFPATDGSAYSAVP
jgi:hypothetical protein